MYCILLMKNKKIFPSFFLISGLQNYTKMLVVFVSVLAIALSGLRCRVHAQIMRDQQSSEDIMLLAVNNMVIHSREKVEWIRRIPPHRVAS